MDRDSGARGSEASWLDLKTVFVDVRVDCPRTRYRTSRSGGTLASMITLSGAGQKRPDDGMPWLAS